MVSLPSKKANAGHAKTHRPSPSSPGFYTCHLCELLHHGIRGEQFIDDGDDLSLVVLWIVQDRIDNRTHLQWNCQTGCFTAQDDKARRYLVYLEYWTLNLKTLNLKPLMVYP